MRLIKYILKDKIFNMKADIRDLFDCIKDYIETTRRFNKNINKLYINMIKLRYYSFKIKYSKDNIIDYHDRLLNNNYIWNIINYYDGYTDDENEINMAMESALGKNNNKTYKIYYTMNVYDGDTEYYKEIKGHTEMIMWCYINQEEDIVSVTNIELIK